MENIGFVVLTLLWHIVLFAIVVAVLWWVVQKVLALPVLAGVRPYAVALIAILVGMLVLAFVFGEVGWWGDWGVGHHAGLLASPREHRL
jgi:hypothetical protein